MAIAAVLIQPDDEGVHHPVAYESRKLTAAEQAYPALGGQRSLVGIFMS